MLHRLHTYRQHLAYPNKYTTTLIIDMLTGRTRSLCRGYLSNISEYIYTSNVIYYSNNVTRHFLHCLF